MPLDIQPATIKQKSQVIPLLDASSDGNLRFLINNILPFINVNTIMAMLYSRDDNLFSYLNAHIGLIDNRVAGLLMASSSDKHELHDIMRQQIPNDRLEHLAPFFSSRVENSLYLSAIAVTDNHQHQGVASQLLSYATNQLAQEYSSLSAHIWADNTAALHFYKKHGFTIEQALAIESHPRLVHSGGMLLMVKSLGGVNSP